MFSVFNSRSTVLHAASRHRHPFPSIVCDRRLSRRRECGFTLIELLVVLAILGLLIGFVAPAALRQLGSAKHKVAEQSIARLVGILDIYKLDVGAYPTTEQGLAALVKPPTVPPLAPNWKTGGYLERMPRDPWGNPYQYLNPGLRGEIDVFSFGADGVAGGDGFDADVGSWSL